MWLESAIAGLEIELAEVQERDYICRGSDQLYNSCKESRGYICKDSPEDYSTWKRMIFVEGLMHNKLTYVTLVTW